MADGIESIENGGTNTLDNLLQNIGKVSSKSFGADSEFDKQFGQYRRQASQKIEDQDTTQKYQGLDGTITQMNEFNQIVIEMNRDLAKYFATYEETLGDIQEYSGFLEKFAANWLGEWGKAYVARKVYDRMGKNPLDKSAHQILSHGSGITKIIARELGHMEEAYKNVVEDRIKVTTEWGDAQKGFDNWSAVYKDKSTEVSILKDKLNITTDNTRPKLEQDLAIATRYLEDAQKKRDQYEVIVTKCAEQSPILEKHLESYTSVISNLRNMRQNIQQDVLHYANILPQLQQVLQAVQAVKGADMFGDQMRSTVNGSTVLVSKAAKEVAVVAAKMLETKPLTEEEFDTVKRTLLEASELYNNAFAKVEEQNKTLYRREDVGTASGNPAGM